MFFATIGSIFAILSAFRSLRSNHANVLSYCLFAGRRFFTHVHLLISPRFIRLPYGASVRPNIADMLAEPRMMKGRMFIIFEDRPSDSPFVERVWRCHSERAGTFHSMAASHWEMVVTRHRGKAFLTVRGPETKATTADCPAEGEWVAIRFKLGIFMPILPARNLRDRRDVNLPEATSRSFWLNGSAWEYPDFENAETFVKRLVSDGLIAVDLSVDAALQGQPREQSIRFVQRHFLQATGITHSTVRQIERARHATNLL